VAQQDKTLKIIHNLEMVTDAEREQYKRDVSAHLGLDPDMNALDLLWIPCELTGLKKLVLYARRGVTDILRDRYNISIDDMQMLHLDSQKVVFKALGHNENGRKEAAIGAHSLEGLKDERLAAAIATAETRAGRRLTLKFVGLGILDASEVNMDYHLENSKAAGVTLAQNPMPPMFAPPATPLFTQKAEIAKDTQEAMNRMIQAEFEAQQAKLRAEAKGPLSTVADVTLQPLSQAPETVAPPTYTVRDTGGLSMPVIEATVVSFQESKGTTVPEPKKRKPRTPKAVNLASPGQDVPKPAPTGEEGAVGTGYLLNPPLASPKPKPIPAAVPVLAPAPPQVSPAVPAQAAPVPPAVVNFLGKPSPEQEEQYRTFLRDTAFKLTNAGMMPSEGIGGPTSKLRIFAQYMAGKPVSQMTTDDWVEFMSFFTNFTARNSPQNLVKYINDAIGAK
jgi:hypothetical protein